MAHLHVKTPNGTNYSIDLNATSFDWASNASLGANGWCKLPNGLIIQWSSGSIKTGTNTVSTWTLPTLFPSLCANVTISCDASSSSIHTETCGYYTHNGITLNTMLSEVTFHTDFGTDTSGTLRYCILAFGY